jgi:hypothetical protein
MSVISEQAAPIGRVKVALTVAPTVLATAFLVLDFPLAAPLAILAGLLLLPARRSISGRLLQTLLIVNAVIVVLSVVLDITLLAAGHTPASTHVTSVPVDH